MAIIQPVPQHRFTILIEGVDKELVWPVSQQVTRMSINMIERKLFVELREPIIPDVSTFVAAMADVESGLIVRQLIWDGSHTIIHFAREFHIRKIVSHDLTFDYAEAAYAKHVLVFEYSRVDHVEHKVEDFE